MPKDMETLYLDTETTGLHGLFAGGSDEIVELAIVDDRGEPVIHTLVKPSLRSSWPDAQRIHGISPAEVADAPTLVQLLPEIRKAVASCRVVIYNANFDIGFFPADVFASSSVECAMLAYAEHVGEWNDYRGNYRWHKLVTAAQETGFADTVRWHRALGDALAARHVWRAVMAAKWGNNPEYDVTTTPGALSIHFLAT
jgi:DNA polymerase-3 subunit epsilon